MDVDGSGLQAELVGLVEESAGPQTLSLHSSNYYYYYYYHSHV